MPRAYWSPMSVGSWALLLFGLFSGLSFVGVLAEEGRFGLGRFSRQAAYLHRGPVGYGFENLGTLVGFFIAAYTGALLTATNQPIWSDSTWIAPLFLASAASTGISTLMLILILRRAAPESSIRRLELTDRWAMVLELAPGVETRWLKAAVGRVIVPGDEPVDEPEVVDGDEDDLRDQDVRDRTTDGEDSSSKKS